MKRGSFGAPVLIVFLLVASPVPMAQASEDGDEQTASAQLQEDAPEDEGKDPGSLSARNGG